MKVNLMGYTRPSKYLLDMFEDEPDFQDIIAFMARVSNPSNQTNQKTTEKLIKFLLDHKHFSPFEMVNVCLEIETTRDIGRQILRHRSFSFQEFSQRYSDPTKSLEFETRECRMQDKKNRQGSLETNDKNIKVFWKELQLEHIERAKSLYQWALGSGIAKEQARAVLPEGNTVSKMYMNGTIRSWIHYIEARTDKSTQKEHRMVAFECANVIMKVFPAIGNHIQ